MKTHDTPACKVYRVLNPYRQSIDLKTAWLVGLIVYDYLEALSALNWSGVPTQLFVAPSHLALNIPHIFQGHKPFKLNPKIIFLSASSIVSSHKFWIAHAQPLPNTSDLIGIVSHARPWTNVLTSLLVLPSVPCPAFWPAHAWPKTNFPARSIR